VYVRARILFFCESGEKFVTKKEEMELKVETHDGSSIFEPLLASFFVSLVSVLAVVGVTPILALASTLSSALFDDLLGKKTKKIKKKKVKKNVSFASRELALFGSGALLADACTHGIPNSFRGGAVEGWGEEFAGSCFLVGFLTFYALDCFIRSRVTGAVGPPPRAPPRARRDGGQKATVSSSPSSGGWLNLFADGLHNFTDGIALAMSYKRGGRKAGVATLAALATHELPQEIGDYGVLINCGFSHGHAVGFNFLSATLSIVGTVFAWHIGKMSEKWEVGLEAFCAAGFVFVSISQIVSLSAEDEKKRKSYARDVMSVLLGVLVVYQVHAMFGCNSNHEEGGHHHEHGNRHHHHHHHDEH
jgi:zinc transporter ZupT